MLAKNIFSTYISHHMDSAFCICNSVWIEQKLFFFYLGFSVTMLVKFSRCTKDWPVMAHELTHSLTVSNSSSLVIFLSTLTTESMPRCLFLSIQYFVTCNCG